MHWIIICVCSRTKKVAATRHIKPAPIPRSRQSLCIMSFAVQEQETGQLERHIIRSTGHETEDNNRLEMERRNVIAETSCHAAGFGSCQVSTDVRCTKTCLNLKPWTWNLNKCFRFYWYLTVLGTEILEEKKAGKPEQETDKITQEVGHAPRQHRHRLRRATMCDGWMCTDEQGGYRWPLSTPVLRSSASHCTGFELLPQWWVFICCCLSGPRSPEKCSLLVHTGNFFTGWGPAGREVEYIPSHKGAEGSRYHSQRMA